MEPLKIPLHLDAAEAIRVLKKLEEEGKQAGEKTEEGMHKAKGGTDLLGNAVRDATSMITGMLTVSQGLSMVKEVFSIIRQQAQEGAEWIKQQVEQFNLLRETMRQIQSIQGLQPTTEEAVRLIKRADEARILTPEEEMKGEKAFMQFVSPYMGELEKDGKPTGKKITKETFEKIMPDILAVSKIKDVSPEVAGRIMQPIVKAMPAGTPVSEYQNIFMGLMGVAETSAGSAESTGGQFAELAQAYVGTGLPMGEGKAGLQSALRVLGVQQAVHAGQGGEYARDMIRALGMMRTRGEDTAKEFGLTSTETLEESMEKIRKKWIADGKPPLLDYLQGKIRGRGGFNAAEAMLTHITQGMEGGQLQVMQEAMAAPPTTEKVRKAFEATETGERMMTETGTARAKAIIGAEPLEQSWAAAKGVALGELTKEKRFTPEGYGWGDVSKSWLGLATGGDRNEQMVRQRAVADLVQRAIQAGVPASDYEAQGLAGGIPVHMREGQPSIGMLTEIQARAAADKLLADINAKLGRQNQLMEHDAQRPLTFSQKMPEGAR